ncbi:hypothetical protein BDQ17DRAFT_1499572 [Cyathus striatus]|nr:hypothetical protein BDQ17DRAFT_1499572 [Cyathus striatus]
MYLTVESVPALSAASCKSLCYAIALFLLIGLTASDPRKVYQDSLFNTEVILTLRVWALWGTTRTMAIILVVLNITFLTPIWVSGGLLANSLEFNLQNAHLIREGCIASVNVRFATAGWSVLLAYQAGMLLLMFPPAYRAYMAGDKSTIIEVVIRDGIIYYFYLFLISLINILFTSFMHEYFDILEILARVMYATFSCRVVLHIRENVQNNSEVNSFSGV